MRRCPRAAMRCARRRASLYSGHAPGSTDPRLRALCLARSRMRRRAHRSPSVVVHHAGRRRGLRGPRACGAPLPADDGGSMPRADPGLRRALPIPVRLAPGQRREGAHDPRRHGDLLLHLAVRGQLPRVHAAARLAVPGTVPRAGPDAERASVRPRLSPPSSSPPAARPSSSVAVPRASPGTSSRPLLPLHPLHHSGTGTYA